MHSGVRGLACLLHGEATAMRWELTVMKERTAEARSIYNDDCGRIEAGRPPTNAVCCPPARIASGVPTVSSGWTVSAVLLHGRHFDDLVLDRRVLHDGRRRLYGRIRSDGIRRWWWRRLPSCKVDLLLELPHAIAECLHVRRRRIAARVTGRNLLGALVHDLGDADAVRRRQVADV